MRLHFWRRPPPPQPRLSSPAAIAVLEYDLYGVQPQPGTVASAAVGLRALSANYRPGPLDLSKQGAA